MKLVVDIPEAIKEMADEGDKKLIHMMWMLILVDAIKNGVVLPKGHGQLFDERDIVNGNYKIIGNKIYELEPIIEADKEK